VGSSTNMAKGGQLRMEKSCKDDGWVRRKELQAGIINK